MNKKILGLVIALFTILGAVGVYYLYKDSDVDITDHVKFAGEYYGIDEDNVYVYATIDEIINILEKGNGIIYLGFPECPWCESYVGMLNDIAKENNIEKIYYYNILNDRKNNTKNYQKIVEILNKYLLLDDENNPRVFVPDITFVKNGKIIAHDNETSVVTENDGTPETYWTQEKKLLLKEKLTSYMELYKNETCTTCN